MTSGAHRTDVPYVWPNVLRPPPQRLQLVYLDLNHWIALAKARTQHPDGDRFREALDTIRLVKATGRFGFPLSRTHYMEMSGIAERRHRLDVTSVMEELSEFSCVINRASLMQLEIRASLDSATGAQDLTLPFPLVGNGVLQAFGRIGGLRIVTDTGEDVTEEARKGWPEGVEAFDSWQADAERTLARSVLRGAENAVEESELRADGWDPSVARQGAERRAMQEREQAARLSAEPRWRRGRTRDVVAARYLAFECSPWFDQELDARDVRARELFDSRESARRFVDSMPSADVAVSLLTARHRNVNTKWTSRDLFDIDAMSVAVAYCDTVVTERHATHALHAAGLPRRLGTTVIATLAELVDLLRAQLAAS